MKKHTDQRSPQEAKRLADETIRRMIRMAPKTQKEESASGKVTSGHPRGRPKAGE